MTAVVEASILEGAFLDAWTATPVALENRAFQPPQAAPWARLRVLPASAFLAELGAPFYRHSGVVAIEIYTPMGGGAGRARALADEAAAIYRGRRYLEGATQVTCYAPSIIPAGPSDGWYQVNVTVPFQRDTLH